MFAAEAKSALEITKTVLARHGARLAGTPSCLAAAEDLRLLAEGSADRAWTEEFAAHPGAFLGFIRVLVALYALSLPLLVFLPSLAAFLTSLGLAVLVLGFFLYHPILDPFFPRRTGRNVLAVLEPRGETRRQLIVSGHHDSAFIFNFYIDKPERYAFRINSGIGSFAALWLVSLGLASAGAPQAIRVGVALAFLAAFPLVAPLWNFAGKEGTPGAGDNLAASAAALEILRHYKALRDTGRGLEHTRLVFASFDAEEAGLRGARAWAKAHRKEAAELPTWNYNMDCLYKAADARFLSSDINGSVRLCVPLAAACAEEARKCGVPAPVEPIAFLTGGTDAAELAKAGVRATTLISMRWSNESRSAAYHTPADTVEAVEPASVELAISVGVGLAERLDRGELD